MQVSVYASSHSPMAQTRDWGRIPAGQCSEGRPINARRGANPQSRDMGMDAAREHADLLMKHVLEIAPSARATL